MVLKNLYPGISHIIAKVFILFKNFTKMENFHFQKTLY